MDQTVYYGLKVGLRELGGIFYLLVTNHMETFEGNFVLCVFDNDTIFLIKITPMLTLLFTSE